MFLPSFQLHTGTNSNRYHKNIETAKLYLFKYEICVYKKRQTHHERLYRARI